MSPPTRCLPGPGFLYGKDTLQNTLHSSCAYCYRQKPEINIYYTSDMLYFFEKSSKAKFQDIYGNIMAQKPAILVCFGLCLLTKRPRLGVAIE